MGWVEEMQLSCPIEVRFQAFRGELPRRPRRASTSIQFGIKAQPYKEHWPRARLIGAASRACELPCTVQPSEEHRSRAGLLGTASRARGCVAVCTRSFRLLQGPVKGIIPKAAAKGQRVRAVQLRGIRINP